MSVAYGGAMAKAPGNRVMAKQGWQAPNRAGNTAMRQPVGSGPNTGMVRPALPGLAPGVSLPPPPTTRPFWMGNDEWGKRQAGWRPPVAAPAAPNYNMGVRAGAPGVPVSGAPGSMARGGPRVAAGPSGASVLPGTQPASGLQAQGQGQQVPNPVGAQSQRADRYAYDQFGRAIGYTSDQPAAGGGGGWGAGNGFMDLLGQRGGEGAGKLADMARDLERWGVNEAGNTAGMFNDANKKGLDNYYDNWSDLDPFKKYGQDLLDNKYGRQADDAARANLREGIGLERDASIRQQLDQANRGGRMSSGGTQGAWNAAMAQERTGERDISQDSWKRQLDSMGLGNDMMAKALAAKYGAMADHYTDPEDILALIMQLGPEMVDAGTPF